MYIHRKDTELFLSTRELETWYNHGVNINLRIGIYYTLLCVMSIPGNLFLSLVSVIFQSHNFIKYTFEHFFSFFSLWDPLPYIVSLNYPHLKIYIFLFAVQLSDFHYSVFQITYVFCIIQSTVKPFLDGDGTHSSTLAWKIPWTEEPGGLQSMGSLRVGHD